jgi:hypothetical protein
VADEKTADTELAATSAAVNLASTAFTIADDAHAEPKMMIVMVRGPIRRLAVTMATKVAPVCLRPVRRRPRC